MTGFSLMRSLPHPTIVLVTTRECSRTNYLRIRESLVNRRCVHLAIGFPLSFYVQKEKHVSMLPELASGNP